MQQNLEDRVAEHLVAILPWYHTALFRAGPKKTGMQAAQFRLLGVLMKEGRLPMSELGRRLYISKPYMTILVDNLIENGYVERIPHQTDRRVTIIGLTRAGAGYLKESGSMYMSGLKDLLSALDDDDLAILCTSLETIRPILAKIS